MSVTYTPGGDNKGAVWRGGGGVASVSGRVWCTSVGVQSTTPFLGSTWRGGSRLLGKTNASLLQRAKSSRIEMYVILWWFAGTT